MTFAQDEIDYRSMRVAVEGKLNGSRARRLGQELERLHADGYDQIVLDLRRCPSLDSVGGIAIRRALEAGQRLFPVLAPGAAADEVLPPEVALDPRLRIFDEAADAVRHARARDASGVLLA